MAMLIGLSILATVLITNGWDNDGVQTQVEQRELERAQQAPRL